jgi:WD40 repeat protein
MVQDAESLGPTLANNHSASLSDPPEAEKSERATQSYEYDAFVSYRRSDATRLAQWIRIKLQRFRLPPEILRDLSREKQELHSRGPQIWLDTSYEKSNDDFLLKKVFPALDKSARLIVLSTPAALANIVGEDGKAYDNWLVREVDHFLGNARAGETDRPVDLVLGPGASEDRYPGRLSEKQRWDWIDLRGFNAWRVLTFTDTLDDGLAKLVAGLYDVPDRLLPVLRREERRRRQRTIIGIAVVGLVIAVLMAALAIFAWNERTAAISSLRNALEARASMSVRLANEELQKKDPDSALATALAGVDTPSLVEKDRAVIPDSVTAVANSIANESFGGTLHEHSDAVLRVFLGPGGASAVTLGADDKGIAWSGENGHSLRPVRSTLLAGNAFAAAQNGGLIASGSTSGQVRFWNSSAPELSPMPFDFGETPVTLAFNENGRLIAALGTAGRLAVWDVAKNSVVLSARTRVPNASTIVFGPNCGCLAVGTSAGDLLIWSLDGIDPLIVRGASGRVTNAGFGRDGEFLFVTDDGRLWLTSAPSWPAPVNIGRHDGRITGFALASDGKLATTIGTDRIAYVWDLPKRAISKKIGPVVGPVLSSVAFSPAGNALAVAYDDGTIEIWDIGNSGTEVYQRLVMHGHGSAVLNLSFSPDGNWLASASLDRSARVWNLQTARHPLIQRGHQEMTIHALSNNGQYLITSSPTDQKVQLWTRPNWQPRHSVVLEDQPAVVAISNDGKQAFIGTGRGDLLQWDTGGSTPTPFSTDNGAVASIVISPDGKMLAAIGVNGILQLCSIVTSPPQCSVIRDLAPSWGYSVAFSEDSRMVGAAAGTEGTSGLALVWDLDASKPRLLKGHTDRISSIQFDKSGKKAFTASWDGTARIWDVSSGKELVRLEEPKGRMSIAGFSSDGARIVTSSHDKTLRLWSIPKATNPGQTVSMKASDSELISDTETLDQVKIDPGGNLLAAALSNGSVHLWHLTKRKLRAVLEGDGSPIHAMYFQPNGLQVTATTTNGNLIIWNLSPALGLEDDSLLPVARSMLPLPGSLVGKLEEVSAAQSVTSAACRFAREHNLGLPPHNLSGAARARLHVSIPDSCRSILQEKKSTTLLHGLIAETEGDFSTAFRSFTADVIDGESSAELGLGDLTFVDGSNGAERNDALGHYNSAWRQHVPHAASRLGWIYLAEQTAEGTVQAKKYFEEASKDGDADGFAGLAWISEKVGKSVDDLETAFSNYVKAQYAYERDGDIAFAQEVAERRAMLARLISLDRLANLFLSTRASIASLEGKQ